MTAEGFYQGCLKGAPCRESHVRAAWQLDWLTRLLTFDQTTWKPHAVALSTLLHDIVYDDRSTVSLPHDRLWHIQEMLMPAFRRVRGNLHTELITEHKRVHFSLARRLDVTSFIKLSSRPGRNIREKLSKNKYIDAPVQRSTLDTVENRLLKACVERIVRLNSIKAEAFDCRERLNIENPELTELQEWLELPDLQEIGPWRNEVPNNALIGNPDYNTIWRCWCDLEDMGSILEDDVGQTKIRTQRIKFWECLSSSIRNDTLFVADVPLSPDYRSCLFNLPSRMSTLIAFKGGRCINLSIGDVTELQSDGSCCRAKKEKEMVDGDVSLDIVPMVPRYVVGILQVECAPEYLVWQDWKTAAISLPYAKSLYFADEVETITVRSLFFSDTADAILETAASAFASTISRRFVGRSLVLVLPDDVPEYQPGLVALRSRLKMYYEFVEIVPYSIAYVYQKGRHEHVRDGKRVAIKDISGIMGRYTVRLVARYSEKLDQLAPATHGIFWERSSIEPSETGDGGIGIVELPYFSGNEFFRNAAQIPYAGPVCGGAIYMALAKCVSPMRLWYDYLPTLGMEVMCSGEFRRINLIPAGVCYDDLKNGVLDVSGQFRIDPNRGCKFALKFGSQKMGVYSIWQVMPEQDSDLDTRWYKLRIKFSKQISSFELVFVPPSATNKSVVAVKMMLDKSIVGSQIKIGVNGEMGSALMDSVKTDAGNWETRIQAITPENLNQYANEIEQAIGGATQQWQQRLLSKLLESEMLNKKADKVMSILAHALNRGNGFLVYIGRQDMSRLLTKIRGLLRSETQQLTSSPARWLEPAIRLKLRLLNEIIRVGKKNFSVIQWRFVPGSQSREACVERIDELWRRLSECGLLDKRSEKRATFRTLLKKTRSALTIDVRKDEEVICFKED